MTPRALAIDLDGALGDTRPLWLDWLRSAEGLLGVDLASLSEDRVAAARELDALDTGNWRALLERFAEERAPVYLRRDAAASAAVRSLDAAGRRLGVFTDAPEALARVALRQLGALDLVASVGAGEDALDVVLEALGRDAVVVHSRDELIAAAA
jgi:phosphoglycolate phosphatase-like HAD superfamily hydrolase